jgi:hypothetical protein
VSFTEFHDRVAHALDLVQALHPSDRPLDPDTAPQGRADGAYSYTYDFAPASGSEERSRDRHRLHAILAITWVRKVDVNDHLDTQRRMLLDADAIHGVLMDPASDFAKPLSVLFVSGPGFRMSPSREWMFGRQSYSADFYLEL